MYNPHKVKLVAKLAVLNIFALLFFCAPADTNCAPVVETINKADILKVEEPLILSALRCIYPDETFQRATAPGFAKYALVSTDTLSPKGYWSVKYNLDYAAIFINLDKHDEDSIDVFDWQAYAKEDTVANDSPYKQCVSIWLVSPEGDYDVIWFDPDIAPEKIREKNGFSIHLNPR